MDMEVDVVMEDIEVLCDMMNIWDLDREPMEVECDENAFWQMLLALGDLFMNEEHYEQEIDTSKDTIENMTEAEDPVPDLEGIPGTCSQWGNLDGCPDGWGGACTPPLPTGIMPQPHSGQESVESVKDDVEDMDDLGVDYDDDNDKEMDPLGIQHDGLGLEVAVASRKLII